MIGVVKTLRSYKKRALNLAPPHLHRYFEERLLAASWYPEEDFRDLTLLLGRLMAVNVEGNVWRVIGAMGAARDFQTTYAAVIRRGDPERTLRRFPDGWRMYRDSGRLVLEEAREGFARVAVYEYPVMCAQLADVNAAYLEGALKAAGARARAEVVTFDGSSAVWHLAWEMAPAG
jgi:uncharacterized protein (TIGR02265 family)